MIDISAHVQDFLCRRDLAGCRLLAGFSGGADSTALLLALRAAGAVDLLAVHCHHGLRGADADADAAWCRAFCEQREIAFRMEYLDVPGQRQGGESTEEAGRRLRLALWQRLAAADNAAVFLGHHADDVMEELLLRLARGANCSGLTGLREERRFGDVRIFRPLLACRRCDIERWLFDQGVCDWRKDRSNADCVYRRNAVRHDLLPLFRKIFTEDGGLQQASRVLRHDADFLEAAAVAAYRQLDSLQSWQCLHPALLPRVLRLWLEDHGGAGVIPGAALLARLQTALANHHGGTHFLPVNGAICIALSAAGLALADATTAPNPAGREWLWQREPEFLCDNGMVLQATPLKAGTAQATTAGANEELFAASALPAVLTVRAWRNGDRIWPFASRHHTKLQDIFTDAKIGRHERRRWPVLLAGDDIIWLPGLRRAEFGRVGADDTEVLRIRCSGADDSAISLPTVTKSKQRRD